GDPHTHTQWPTHMPLALYSSTDPPHPPLPPRARTPPPPAVPSSLPPSPPIPAAQPRLSQGPINTAFPGLTTFRGNATRDYYGEGPLPSHPAILWRYPTTGGMCMQSSSLGKTQTWCGTGWTGQPTVIPHTNATTE